MRRISLVLLMVGQAAASAAVPTLDLQLVTGNVTNPVYVTHAGDDSGRLFIVEQGGRIKIHDGTTLLATPFLDFANRVNPSGEQGLLSMAFHPGYKTNGHFYVYFTNPAGTSNIVARFTASPPSANTVATNTLQTVLPIAHVNADNHNGGQIQFGPDGFLYIAPGDGGGACDDTGSGNNAQNLGSPLGKMLRINVNNFSTNYTIPPSNPFIATNGARPEIWAYGLRNPFRFSFDRLAGDLFIADVGQGTREEIDFQPATSTGGQNYGWKCIEGTATNTCDFLCPGVIAVPPILEYSRSPSRAITGGYRYRGNAITSLFGAYLYCDYFNPAPITAATTNAAGAWTTNLLLTAAFHVSSFGEDQAGEIYVCRHSSTAGAIYRLVWRDTDGDGMADDWENENGFNPSDAADAALDADGDGASNVQEFAAATNPHDASSVLRVVATTPSGNDWTVTVNTSSNKLYRLERTDDLEAGNWVTITNNLLGTGGALQITDPGAAALPQRFYRVRRFP